jgi:hypothetical protein
MSDDNKKVIVDFALKELEKALSDLKNGIEPTISKGLKKLQETIVEANKKSKNLKPEEEDKLIDDIVKNISKDIKQD